MLATLDNNGDCAKTKGGLGNENDKQQKTRRTLSSLHPQEEIFYLAPFPCREKKHCVSLSWKITPSTFPDKKKRITDFYLYHESLETSTVKCLQASEPLAFGPPEKWIDRAYGAVVIVAEASPANSCQGSDVVLLWEGGIDVAWVLALILLWNTPQSLCTLRMHC